MPDPAAAGAKYTVMLTEVTTSAVLISMYTRYEASGQPRSSKVNVAQNLNPLMFSTPRLTQNAAPAVITPT